MLCHSKLIDGSLVSCLFNFIDFLPIIGRDEFQIFILIIIVIIIYLILFFYFLFSYLSILSKISIVSANFDIIDFYSFIRDHDEFRVVPFQQSKNR